MLASERTPSQRRHSALKKHAARRAPQLDLLLSQLVRSLRVAVIHGGNKTDAGAVLRQSRNPRSWKSYQAVANNIADALGRIGFEHVAVLPDDMRLASELKARRINLAWVNSGGVQGRSAISHAPSLLEMLGIPYVGHDPLTAALLDSKHHFKRQLQSLGIATAPFLLWQPGECAALLDKRIRSTFAKWPHGFVVKPVTGRASLHVHFVERARDVLEVARDVYGVTQNTVLIEAFLPGREYCVAVCGPVIAQKRKHYRLPGPFAFSAIERMLEDGENIFTSMDVKPITAARTRPLVDARDAAVVSRLHDIARDVFIGVPLQTLVRIDLRADDRGNPYVLEANPKPDLAAPSPKSTNLICAGLKQYGMSYDDLIQSILADHLATLFDDRPNTVADFFQSFQFAHEDVR
jgi:D-alanine-D-alanine ligase